VATNWAFESSLKALRRGLGEEGEGEKRRTAFLDSIGAEGKPLGREEEEGAGAGAGAEAGVVVVVVEGLEEWTIDFF